MPDVLGGTRHTRLLLSTDAVGGVWRYALDLASGLSERGVGSVLAVLGPAPGPAQRAEAEAVPGLHLVLPGLPLDWTAEDVSALRRAQDKLRSLAALLGCTGIHLHTSALVGDRPWPVPVVAVAHSCVATWWQAVRGGALPADFAWRTALAAEGFAHADAVIAPSHAHAVAVRAAYGPVPIQVVHNGRRPMVRPPLLRRRAVLTAGRLWDDGKDVATLDRAAAVLDAPVWAAGPLAGPNGAVARFTHLDPLGALDELALAMEYASASAFASVARYEPFGLAVLEAAQAGLPLVLSDIPTFRELWDGAARFVPPGDDAALADTLRAALDSDDGYAARAQARAGRYTVAAMVDGTLAVHRGLRVGV